MHVGAVVQCHPQGGEEIISLGEIHRLQLPNRVHLPYWEAMGLSCRATAGSILGSPQPS
jgi:hypothetical protein